MLTYFNILLCLKVQTVNKQLWSCDTLHIFNWDPLLFPYLLEVTKTLVFLELYTWEPSLQSLLWALGLKGLITRCWCVPVFVRPRPAPRCTADPGFCSLAACHWCRRKGNTRRGERLPPRHTLNTHHTHTTLSVRERTPVCVCVLRLHTWPLPLLQLLASCQRRLAEDVWHAGGA